MPGVLLTTNKECIAAWRLSAGAQLHVSCPKVSAPVGKMEEHTELAARSEAAEEADAMPLPGRLPFLKRAPPLRMAKGSILRISVRILFSYFVMLSFNHERTGHRAFPHSSNKRRYFQYAKKIIVTQYATVGSTQYP